MIGFTLPGAWLNQHLIWQRPSLSDPHGIYCGQFDCVHACDWLNSIAVFRSSGPCQLVHENSSQSWQRQLISAIAVKAFTGSFRRLNSWILSFLSDCKEWSQCFLFLKICPVVGSKRELYHSRADIIRQHNCRFVMQHNTIYTMNT